MNIPLFRAGGSSPNGIFAGSLSIMQGNRLKSTQEKEQRQQLIRRIQQSVSRKRPGR